MDRRELLNLGGAGLAGIVLLGTVGSHSVLAQEGSSLVEEFEEAAEKYRVPKTLLLAIGYVNIRWERPTTLGDYLSAVDGEGGNGKVFEAVAGIGGGELYADQISEALEKRASARMKSGEDVSLPAQSLTSRVTDQGELL